MATACRPSRDVTGRDGPLHRKLAATGPVGLTWFAAIVALALPSAAAAAEPPDLDVERTKRAVTKSITLVEKSAAEYRKQRQCFSCHHQAAPVLMLALARDRGFAIDRENFEAQLDHTAAHLKRGADSYRGGQGQGGKADTAGWALWTLDIGGCTPNETTTAVAQFLLTWQNERDHWRSASKRPPTEASPFTTTYVALRALNSFGTDDLRSQIVERRERALQWLITAEANDTEDRVFRLRALNYFEAGQEATDAAAKELLKHQADDGGWSQTGDLKSDGYATGTALATLHETGHLSADDAAYRNGADFLLRTQLDDGSWRVATRSKPIQEYFESGFPHGKDQFISISATCWATTALLYAHPRPSE